MRRWIGAICCVFLLLVMVYPHRHLGVFDLESSAIQASVLCACTIAWAFMPFEIGGQVNLLTAIRYRVISGVITLILAAAVLEYFESFEKGREARVGDLMINAVAVLITGLLCYGLALIVTAPVKTAQDIHDEIYGGKS